MVMMIHDIMILGDKHIYKIVFTKTQGPLNGSQLTDICMCMTGLPLMLICGSTASSLR